MCEERVFDEDATTTLPTSSLERIYINGQSIDEPLLCAIDGDGDGALNTDLNQTNGNLNGGVDGVLGAFPSTLNPTNGVSPGLGGEFEYYHLDNRLGSTMALLDAGVSSRVLEYYRYQAFGEVMVLPVVDNNLDGFEDTPDDLTDNNDEMLTLRSSEADPSIGRVSQL